MPIYRERVPTWECRTFDEGLDGRVNIGGWAVANGITVDPQNPQDPQAMVFHYEGGGSDTVYPGVILQLVKVGVGYQFVIHDPSDFYKEYEQVSL